MIRGVVLSGAYFDSVMLMAVSQRLKRLPGVNDVALHMGTPTNKAILRSAGLFIPAFEHAGADDLMVAVSALDANAGDAAMAALDDALRSAGDDTERGDAPLTVDRAAARLPDANVALVSVPGRYAADEAFASLELGLHVMIFSDNVSIDDEVALKRRGRARGLLVMGPDCGSALIGGVPLGFANAVNRGRVGIVSASGTGLQEVSCVVSNEGEGISHAIGVGGRDTSRAVGGLMFLEALHLLDDDPGTQVIVMVSKTPDPDVTAAIAGIAAGLRCRAVALFLGDPVGTGPWCAARTLQEAGLAAAALARGHDVTEVATLLGAQRRQLDGLAASLRDGMAPSQRFVRGLFSGGTLCQEAVLVTASLLGEVHSNVAGGVALADSWTSTAHTMLDMGADDFTVGRPHPMIDYSLRCRRIAQEAADPEVAVVVLDVVLGYGAHQAPSSELVPAIRDASSIAARDGRRLAVVCAVIGTPNDPQCRTTVEQALRDAGAAVVQSNAAAAHLAAATVRGRAS